jgi:hypothetical protein
MSDSEQFWGAKIRGWAAEVAAEAQRHHESLNLHTTLNDLDKVLHAYAGRLSITVTPPGVMSTEAAMEPLAETPVAVGAVAEFAQKLRDEMRAFQKSVEDRLAALNTVGATDVPGWLLDTLDDHNRRITALEERANFGEAVIPQRFMPEEPLDIDPAAWDSIERARKALQGLLRHEFQTRTALRLNLLARVTSLSRLAVRDEGQEAELRQHEGRVVEQQQIEAVYGAKRDEIEALDDLEIARTYNVKAGWP